MKPRHLIEAKESVGAELALALERIAVLEARMDQTEAREDRQLTASCRQNDRIARLEEHAGIDAQPEIVGQTIRGSRGKGSPLPVGDTEACRGRPNPVDAPGRPGDH